MDEKERNSGDIKEKKPDHPKADGTEFRDLLRGRIDIIEYLNAAGGTGGERSGANSVDNASLAELTCEEKASLQQILMKPSAVLHHQANGSVASTLPPHQRLTVQAGQNNGHSSSSSTSNTAHPQPSPSTGRRSGMFPRMEGVPHLGRLPDSPPETDSAAGSAGSPSSGSDNSPYSPEYHNFHHGQLPSVIHPPVGGAHPLGGGGVILGVQDLSQLVHPDLMPGSQHHQAGRISAMTSNHHHPVPHGQLTPNNNGGEYPYPPPQPTPGALAPPQISPPGMGGSACPPSPYVMPPNSNSHTMDTSGSVYNGDGSLGRKRLRSDSGLPLKRDNLSSPRTSVEESGGYDMDGYHQQCIRFSEFQKENWHSLCDSSGRELQRLGFHVVADKGFNYSAFDGTFVNQKKNHFQISVHIEAHDPSPPKYVLVDGQHKAISEFRLDFYGVKAEMLSSTIQIKQSQTDRKPIGYEPVRLDLPASRVTKVTVARLHFSETTMNNQRKNGRPNPDQKYLYLVTSLNAKLQDGEEVVVVSFASEKVIVRASNPGQFDNGESEVPWQKGQIPNSIYHMGAVGVGTDRPHAPLTVAGDIACTGQFLHPSDRKFKENIQEYNYRDALSRLSQIRIVQYEIRPEIAERWGLEEHERSKVGVVAQELERVLPDAVKCVEDDEFEDHLEVDDSRLFYESAAAVKELCRLTGNLEYKIEEVEKISRKLAKYKGIKRLDSLRSTASSKASSGISSNIHGSYLSCSRSTLGSTSPDPTRKNKEGVENAAGPHVKYTSGRHRHRDDPNPHRHCHHYCTRADRGICSNKIIQSTIIVLVVVMAFCLIAMATLYILDWHKRNTGSTIHPYHGSSTASGDGTAIAGSIPPNVTDPPKGPGEMAMTNHPSGGHRNQPPYLINKNWPGGTPPPELQTPCVTLNCPRFCCPNILSYGTYNQDGKPQTKDDAVQLRLLTNKAHPVGATFRGKTTEPIVEDKTDFSHPRHRRSSKSGSGSGGGQLEIEVLGQNMTIGSQNCLMNSCDEKKKNFTLYVPVSQYMPFLSLEIELKAARKQYVNFCGHDFGLVCSGADKKPNGEEQAESPFEGSIQLKPMDLGERNSVIAELPVGLYVVSAYKFRVGHSTTSCEESSDMVGETFEEYTLVFYRVCSGVDPTQ